MIRARTKEWVRQVPVGWRDGRLKDFFSYAKGLNITKADLVEDGVAVVSYGQIHAKHNTGTHLDQSLIRYVPEEIAVACPNSRLKKGDVVFADTSEDLDGVGNCVLNDSDGEVYAGYHALIARARFPEHSKYLSYLFQTDEWRGQVRTRASGIKVFSLTQRVLNPVTVILPPLPEQKRIAAFLDAKCADIDKAIEAKRKQLDCIDEMWKNILYKATTQGLGTARMVKTKNRLFPEIPNGWRLHKIARCFDTIGSGTTPKSHNQDYYDGETPWLQSGDLHGRYVDVTAKCVSELALKDCNLTIFKAPFIAIAMYGASIANTSIVRIDACTNQACCTLNEPRWNVCQAFVYYSLCACKDAMLMEAHGGTQPNISREIIRKIKIPLPPYSEQFEIANYLDAKRKNLDELTDNLRRQIEVLADYRKSLIHEYVTGERRVAS